MKLLSLQQKLRGIGLEHPVGSASTAEPEVSYLEQRIQTTAPEIYRRFLAGEYPNVKAAAIAARLIG